MFYFRFIRDVIGQPISGESIADRLLLLMLSLRINIESVLSLFRVDYFLQDKYATYSRVRKRQGLLTGHRGQQCCPVLVDDDDERIDFNVACSPQGHVTVKK